MCVYVGTRVGKSHETRKEPTRGENRDLGMDGKEVIKHIDIRVERGMPGEERGWGDKGVGRTNQNKACMKRSWASLVACVLI